MIEIVAVVGQVVLAVLSVRVVAQRLSDALAYAGISALVTSVWGPVALVLPLGFVAAFVETGADRAVQMMVTGPVVVMALGCVMVSGLANGGWSRGPALAVIGVGSLLLLVSAAYELTVWTGQCALAIGAVLMWMNTPREAAGDGEQQAAEHAANGLVMLLVLAAGQGLAVWMAGRAWLPVTAGIAVSAAVVMLGLMARRDVVSAGRLAAWTGALGVLMMLGVLAVRHVGHQIVGRSTLVGGVGAGRQVVHSMGVFAPEAVAMVVLGGLMLVGGRWRGVARWLMVVMAVLLLSVVGWRWWE